ncbi:hypothetical protein ACM64Y_08625 [Novispirillum sp. DQ9]|uniref:hypothetical protein n=1 Tax=Novispirillum sp. DQ9 TaxID=3398612 RepID=UPI003C7BA05C
MPTHHLRDFAPLLTEAADRLDLARSVDAVRDGLAFNRALWTRLHTQLAHATATAAEPAPTLKRFSEYVVRTSTPTPCPPDDHIEAFIRINRNASRWLAG